jgi:hypothetical protein
MSMTIQPPELIQLQQNRLLSYADGKLSRAPEAAPLARVVAAVFDTYLQCLQGEAAQILGGERLELAIGGQSELRNHRSGQ